MDFNLTKNLEYCASIVDPMLSFLYYSHIPVMIVSLLFGIFVIKNSSNKILSRSFFGLASSFSFWTAFSLFIWTHYESSSQTMFAWLLVDTFDLLFFVFAFYFVYVYLNKKDISFFQKSLFLLPLIPLILSFSTKYGLNGFDLTDCVSQEGVFYSKFIFSSEIFIFLLIIINIVSNLLKTWKNKPERKEILLLSFGVVFFLISFFVSGYIADSTDYYQYEQIGLFSMLVFLGFLAYIIVEFKAFKVRLFGAQAIVIGLITLIGSKLFTAEAGVNRTITIVTLGFVSLFGYFLIKSVKKEIEARERIEKLADELEHANERLHVLDQQKSQFVSIASHQLRAPLTAIKGYLSMIMEGDYGKVEGELREIIQRVMDSSNNLVTIVGDFLDVSRIEQGKMAYDWKDFDLKPLVETVGNEMKPVADKRGLEFSVSVKEGKSYMVHGDMNKLKQVFTNLVDNSIKYTPKGKVWVELSQPTPGTVRFEVNDNGIGIAAETLPKLFEKFTRAEGANDVNVIGTGLGLYVAKEMVLAHEGGKIWAESDGKGKGSTFVVELKALQQ